MRKQTPPGRGAAASLYVRAVVMGVAGLLCPPGCALSQFRQQAVGYSLHETARVRDGIVAAAKATQEIATEIEVAALQEREPEIAEPVHELATALSSAPRPPYSFRDSHATPRHTGSGDGRAGGWRGDGRMGLLPPRRRAPRGPSRRPARVARLPGPPEPRRGAA